MILAHRGASASAPDNTLTAYALAVAQDADGIEIDVRRTADGRLVLHHDAVVPGIGAIIDLDLDDLRSRAPHVPTLDEMLAVAGDLLIDVEIKNNPNEPDHDPNQGAADAVAAWIARHHLHRRVIVTSFDWAATARIAALDAGITTGQLLATGPLDDLIDAVARAGHSWVLPPDAALGRDPNQVIANAHALGLRIGTWTVDGTERLQTLAAAGIDAIVVNDPARAVAALAG